jgi:glycosyltransferase involved in cell wall biosynthesis
MASSVVVYLHEGTAQLRGFARRDPRRYSHALEVLRSVPVLAASRVQADQLSDIGVRVSDVVYNCAQISVQEPPPRSPHPPQVLMVGTVQPRKGVDLFVAVANQVDGMDFVWIGPGTPPTSSGQARFVGPMDPPAVRAQLRRGSAVLITSTDDPFPLVAAEALAAGTRVVCPDDIGAAELIGGLRGCRTYPRSAGASGAAEALQRSLAEALDVAAARKRLAPLHPSALWERLRPWLMTVN